DPQRGAEVDLVAERDGAGEEGGDLPAIGVGAAVGGQVVALAIGRGGGQRLTVDKALGHARRALHAHRHLQVLHLAGLVVHPPHAVGRSAVRARAAGAVVVGRGEEVVVPAHGDVGVPVGHHVHAAAAVGRIGQVVDV